MNSRVYRLKPNIIVIIIFGYIRVDAISNPCENLTESDKNIEGQTISQSVTPADENINSNRL